MARMTKEEKRIQAECDAAFAKHSHGNPIDVFDISKVLNAGRDAAKEGKSVEEAIVAAFAKYRKS